MVPEFLKVFGVTPRHRDLSLSHQVYQPVNGCGHCRGGAGFELIDLPGIVHSPRHFLIVLCITDWPGAAHVG